MNSSEVVAIESTGSGKDLKLRTNFKPKKLYKEYPYFVDPQIVPRVRQYLEDNKHKVYVDVDEMVADLRRKYRDYGSKKRAAFKNVVEKAFSVVLQTYDMTDQDAQADIESDSSDISDIEDEEELDLIIDKNQGNRQLVNMYMQKKGTVATTKSTNDNKELIDISSDEDEVQAPSKRAKTSNTTTDSKNHNDAKSHSDGLNNQSHSKNIENVGEAVKDIATPNIVVSKSSVEPGNSAGPDRPKRKRANAEATATSNGPSERRRREVPVTTPCKSFKDIGGCSKVLQEVCKLLVHIRHPEIFEQVGISPLRGFLLHGPPGCGKTLLAHAIAGELGTPLLKVSAPELVAGVSGESEERIRDLFDQALSLAPCVLFLDEIDAITPNRNNAQREMERRIVAQLLTSLDELGEKEGGNQVLVVGATNRPDSLDPALRRAGRFDREVCMGIPDREARAHILRVVCGSLALAPEVSSDEGIEELAGLTPGFVGADLTALAREAAMCAINRIFSELNKKKGDGIEINQNRVEEDAKQSQTLNGTGPDLEKSQNENELVIKEPEVENVVSEAMEDTPNSIPPQTDDSSVAETRGTDDTVGIEVEEVIQEGVNEKGSTAGPTEVSSSDVNDTDAPKVCSEVQKLMDAVEGVEVIVNKTPQADVSCDATMQDVEIIASEPKGEKRKDDSEREDFPNKKPASEVEVVEVDMVECSSNSVDESIKMVGSAVPKEVAAASDQAGSSQKLVLSQQLNPISSWNTELCQLLSWLRETPVLTPAQLSGLSISMKDFHEALHYVQPSAKREGFATVPDVTWDDVGSLSNIRTELQLSILAPVRYSHQFTKLGLDVPTGVLLCGPPGCGKTLLAKAIANEAGINFISVKGPELLNMYVGESERAVRQVFQRARNSAPCVIFFDELDALCPKRSDSGDNGVSSRVVNQLLTEMDGVEGRLGVFLMAASNRPDIIDPAVLRPGRLDKVLFVGLPKAEDRIDILRALTKNGTRPLLAPDVDLGSIASSSLLEGYTGADLAALVREAGVQALQEFISSSGDLNAPISIALRHFECALRKIRPSVTDKDRKHYDKLQQMYSSTPSSRIESMDTM